jgi:hypothetical protein
LPGHRVIPVLPGLSGWFCERREVNHPLRWRHGEERWREFRDRDAVPKFTPRLPGGGRREPPEGSPLAPRENRPIKSQGGVTEMNTRKQAMGNGRPAIGSDLFGCFFSVPLCLRGSDSLVWKEREMIGRVGKASRGLNDGIHGGGGYDD